MGKFRSILFVFFIVALHVQYTCAQNDQTWAPAHATFYVDSESEQAACGYTASQQGYGLTTAALSTVLYMDGSKCGACYEIHCKGLTSWGEDACLSGNPSVEVTATNLCPPNPQKPIDKGGWCNVPLKHFDMTISAFGKIGVYKAGIIPVEYRRVSCIKVGGIAFKITGNEWFNLVLVYNVGGVGDVTELSVKGTNTNWLPMKRNWGQNWQCDTSLVSQSLSFKVTTSDNKVVIANDVVPNNWQFGQSFSSNVQF